MTEEIKTKWTSIRISKATRERVKKWGKMGGTYDEAINFAFDIVEAAREEELQDGGEK
jgi:hypothetical protein